MKSDTYSADERISWFASVPFFLVHAIALVAFLLPFHWYWPVLALALYVVRMFAITAGYHRYFAHRGYKTSRWFQFVLALLGATATQKGVLWWAAHHRDHHKYSDQELDVHSPVQRGFYWSHVGWILARKYEPTNFDRIRDFARYPELRWLNRWHALPPIALGVALFLLGGWPALIWGYFVSTTLLFHGTFTINSLSHVWGKVRYPTDDASRNNVWLALITLGEGWHNNHHYYMSTANQGFYWWEIDISYYVLRALSSVRLVWDLRTPPASVLAAGRAGTAVPLSQAETENIPVEPLANIS